MDNNTNYLICTHKDLDGFCCGAILLNKYPRAQIFFATSKSLHKTLYRIMHSLVKDYNNKLFICDISLDGKYVNQINRALRYIRKKNNFNLNLTWFDHHKWPDEERLLENFEKIVDSTEKTAVKLVQKFIAPNLYQDFVDLAEGNTSLTDGEYWKQVIRNVCNTRPSEEKLKPFLKAFSQLKQTKETDEFNIVIKKLTKQDIKGIKVYNTLKRRNFAVIDLRRINYEIHLYREVFNISRIYNCDFICVIFQNEEISCYCTNLDSVSFIFLKDYGAVGHLEKGAVHIPIPYKKTDDFGFQSLLTVEEFINLLKIKL
ncbi:MAG: hypothetical protein ACTSRG_06415 [Candidatus Helarchaeota archaeon]